jgi:hypothetical protein
MRLWMTSAVLAAGLAACATPPMEPSQCAVADWRALGYQDGAAGAAPEKFASREADCARAGYAANFALYSEGRAAGLRDFCSPENGFRQGLDGSSDRSQICPSDLMFAFRLAHEDGARINRAKSSLSSAESTLSSKRSERDRLERKIRGNEDGLFTTQEPAEQQRIRDELRRLREDRNDAEDDIRDAEREVRDAQHELDRLRAQFAGRWGAW